MHNPVITNMNAQLRLQWCKNHRYCDLEEKVTWSDESSLILCSTSCLTTMYGVRWEVGWTFIAYSEGMQWLCEAVGGVLMNTLVLLENGVTANEDKVVLSNRLQKPFCSDDGKQGVPLNGLMSMKMAWIISCGSQSHQLSPFQPSRRSADTRRVDAKSHLWHFLTQDLTKTLLTSFNLSLVYIWRDLWMNNYNSDNTAVLLQPDRGKRSKRQLIV